MSFNLLLFHGVLILITGHSAVVPTALGTALDINLSNASLVFISVTFATMVRYLLQKKGFIHLRLIVTRKKCLTLFRYG